MHWEGCLVTVKVCVQAHQVLLKRFLAFCMRNRDWWKSWRKGSKSAAHSAAVVHTWMDGDETQTLENDLFFVWSVTGSLFTTSKRKTAAVWPQGDQGGDEDDLGWGQAFWYQGPVRRRLTAVVGAYWKVGSDRQYICAKFRENTFLCTSNSFCFISSVAFDFDFTSYMHSWVYHGQ